MEYYVMQERDYDEAYALWTSTPGMGLRSLDDSREGIETFLSRNRRTSFVCRERDRLAGVILCGHDGRRGYIYHAAVHPDFRRRGIGSELVRLALDALKEEGIKKAALVVFASNEEGNSFWESRGFTLREDLSYRNRTLDESNQ
jgi:N-acetylglutamate synthase